MESIIVVYLVKNSSVKKIIEETDKIALVTCMTGNTETMDN
jgi:hypothetical protein